MVGDACEHVGEIVLRVDAVELGAFDQRVHRCGPSAAGIGAGEEPVLAADGDAAQNAFGGVVVEREAAIVEAAVRGGEFGFAR